MIRIASTINDNLIIDYKYDHGINYFPLAILKKGLKSL